MAHSTSFNQKTIQKITLLLLIFFFSHLSISIKFNIFFFLPLLLEQFSSEVRQKTSPHHLLFPWRQFNANIQFAIYLIMKKIFHQHENFLVISIFISVKRRWIIQLWIQKNIEFVGRSKDSQSRRWLYEKKGKSWIWDEMRTLSVRWNLGLIFLKFPAMMFPCVSFSILIRLKFEGVWESEVGSLKRSRCLRRLGDSGVLRRLSNCRRESWSFSNFSVDRCNFWIVDEFDLKVAGCWYFLLPFCLIDWLHTMITRAASQRTNLLAFLSEQLKAILRIFFRWFLGTRDSFSVCYSLVYFVDSYKEIVFITPGDSPLVYRVGSDFKSWKFLKLLFRLLLPVKEFTNHFPSFTRKCRNENKTT
jgi:hypothetical protein